MAYKKEKKIKVDIILPNFNSAEYIKETIQSILKQSFKNWNLIIDDCSDTKTRNILKVSKIKIKYLVKK